jgi:hypothetical protein
MKNTQLLLRAFSSQPLAFAQVCLPVRKNFSVVPWLQHHHKESIGVDLNCHPLAVLPLPKLHPLHAAVSFLRVSNAL